LNLVPNAGYAGSTRFRFVVSLNPNWGLYFAFFPVSQWPPYDSQTYTFAFGDTVISAFGTNFAANALAPFTNQFLATFTNGLFNSAATNFTAFINWGDNSTNSALIVTNLNWKEVRGAHTYTNAGNYPVYVTIQSAAGVTATVVSTANVPPVVTLARTGTTNAVRWPAWAADYHLQANASLASTNWAALTNFPALDGYDNVITNSTTNGNLFFRLKQ
jgi:hypothetical protein